MKIKKLLPKNKRYTDEGYKKLFYDFQNIIIKPFGKDFVDFIDNKSTRELIFLFLKCKELELSILSSNDKLTFGHYQDSILKNKKLSKKETEHYRFLLDQYLSTGIKDPERARMLLNAELNRRLQNRTIIFSFIPAIMAIILSFVTVYLNCNDTNINKQLLKNTLDYQIKINNELQILKKVKK